MKRQQI